MVVVGYGGERTEEALGGGSVDQVLKAEEDV